MVTPSPNSITKRQGAKLPHWTRDGATYSVTFRLADSLPADVLERIRLGRKDIVRRAEYMERPLSVHELTRLEALHSEKIDAYLHAGHGECWLRDPRIANLVKDAMFHFDRDRYDLLAWCVMPNHVHAVLRPIEPHRLDRILHSWKGFTSTEANRLLARKGAFWQSESYDHLIRDEADLAHAIRYVMLNPDRAGLRGWPWAGKRIDWG